MKQEYPIYRSEHVREEKSKRRFLPFLASSIAGAVLGGGIVLYSAPQLGFTNDGSQTNTASTSTNATTTAATKTISTNVSQGDLVSVVDKVSPAVVGVNNIQERTNPFSGDTQTAESGTGSGVIFKKDNNKAYVVTNNHVIEGSSKVEVTLSNGKKEDAQIVGADPLTDLAVLEMDAKNVEAVAEFGDSTSLVAGEPVLAIGNPLGEQFSRTVTQGIVSGTERTVNITTSAGEWNLDVIQTDAAINPGNSGGALINAAGQVIGINSLKIAEDGVEGIGFAIPTADVQPIIDKLMKDGKINRPYMGVGLQDVAGLSTAIKENELGLTEDTSDGVVVTTVEPFSAASEAGLQSKDIIVGIDGKEVKTSSDLRKYLYTERAIGDKVKLDVYRNGKKINLSLTLKQQGNDE
ncbi:trypsin-like peptidase domain-containing protein [Priestia flexa]|uniref:S1C family serine protease n=1 Tax=Priestia flexa TaxID=86664 RepID=UPI001CFDF305|nr:trypsin-like peptidase domain-containing protein [Priestia flexa]UIR32219.1 trypsin-like peptidase domain-containing protein [Priestia flexa]